LDLGNVVLQLRRILEPEFHGKYLIEFHGGKKIMENI